MLWLLYPCYGEEYAEEGCLGPQRELYLFDFRYATHAYHSIRNGKMQQMRQVRQKEEKYVYGLLQWDLNDSVMW